MSPVVTNYKSLVLDNITLSVPEKTKGKYMSYVSNNDHSLFLQTPVIFTKNKTDSSIQFEIKKNSVFYKNLSYLQSHLINYITLNTCEFFNGKNFSREKIESSFENIFSENDDTITLTCIVDEKFIQIRDQRNKEKSYSDIINDAECIAILNIFGVNFKSNKIFFIVKVEQIKIYIQEKLSTWSIERDSDAETEIGDSEENLNHDYIKRQIDNVNSQLQSETSENLDSLDIPELLPLPESNDEASNADSESSYQDEPEDPEINQEDSETHQEEKQQQESSHIINDDDKDLF